MSSSTSSSRPLYAKMLLIILVGMGGAMVVFNVMAHTMGGRVGDTILPRVIEAVDALPRVAAEEDELVMAFGSSMTEAGFSARQFDRQLSEQGIDGIKSFNFGFGGLNPLFQDYFSRRIRDAFQDADKRMKLVLVEFTPLQNTGSRYRGAIPAIDSYVTILASDADLWEITKQDPTRGIRMFNIRYLRRGVSAEMATAFFGEGMFGSAPRRRSEIPEDEEKQAILEELVPQINARFDEDYPDWSGARWSFEWQGAGTIPEERSEETLEMFVRYYDAVRSERRLDDDRLHRINCCDAVDLNFEEILVDAFIRIVRNFQEVADEVHVFLTPQNSDWITYPPDAQARLDAVLERIHAETGAPIRNFQHVDGITPEMFSDTTHLSRYAGDVAFTSHLVDVYAPLLGEGR